MGENADKNHREAYPVKPTDIIQYTWGGIIAYLQKNFYFHINDVLEYAQENGYKGKEVRFAEHVFALLYNGARNFKSGNVRHIRGSKRLDAIAATLQHDFEQIQNSVKNSPPQLTDINLELLAHEFICAIDDKSTCND
ncbi:hypothetical protein JW911_03685 [Candidatus Peregrinibacteria bacterium]|nr:hypothetical protein [Candidatus Peregrinibacteria bacterium]